MIFKRLYVIKTPYKKRSQHRGATDVLLDNRSSCCQLSPQIIWPGTATSIVHFPNVFSSHLALVLNPFTVWSCRIKTTWTNCTHEFRVGRGLGNNPLRGTTSGHTVKIAVVDLDRWEHGKTDNSHSLEVTLPASHASSSR